MGRNTVALGLSTLFIEKEKKGFDSVFQLLSSSYTEQVGFFEIVDDGALKLSKNQAKRLREFYETGTRFTLHSRYDGINIASIDKVRRKASLRAIIDSVDFAEYIGAINVVVHSGAVEFGETHTLCSTYNIESLLEIKDYSTSRDIRIAVENDTPNPSALLIRPDDFKKLFKEHGVKLPLVLDIGHANMSRTIDEYVNTMADAIVEVHLHDNDGTYDGHLEMGKGNVDFKKITPLFFRPSTLFVVESVEGPFKSFDRLISLRKEALSL